MKWPHVAPFGDRIGLQVLIFPALNPVCRPVFPYLDYQRLSPAEALELKLWGAGDVVQGWQDGLEERFLEPLVLANAGDQPGFHDRA